MLLKEIAERYVPILLAISLGLLYEQLTPSYRSVTTTAVEFGKVSLWLLLVPALLICVTVVAFGYQSAVARAEAGMQSIVEASGSGVERDKLLEKVVAARSDLLLETESRGVYLDRGQKVKSGSISIPLLVALTAYVLKSLQVGDKWVEIFIPSGVVNFFKNLYN